MYLVYFGVFWCFEMDQLILIARDLVVASEFKCSRKKCIPICCKFCRNDAAGEVWQFGQEVRTCGRGLSR